MQPESHPARLPEPAVGARPRPPLPGDPVADNLHALPGLLVDEPAVGQVLGRTTAVLAVPEPARAIVVAALARISSRHPIVVATPTTLDAERLARDVGAYLGTEHVDLFGAWETLPFERVSPSTETMGKRLRTLWRLRQPVEDGAQGEGSDERGP